MRVLVFDTTHHALWAEEVALARGFGVDVVPAPSSARARCDLALAYLPDEEQALLATLDAESIPYRIHDEA